MEGGSWSFEYLFDEVDGRSASLVDQIVARRSVSWFSDEDRIAIVDFVATQILRTPAWRKTLQNFGRQIRELVAGFGYDPSGDPQMALPSDNDVKMASARAFLNRGEHTGSLYRLIPALYECPPDNRFVIADDPVTITNVFPYGETGLASHGIIVSLPISPTLALALHCPTLLGRLDLAEQSGLMGEARSRLLAHRKALNSGEPIRLSSEEVRFQNSQQVAQSISFLFSATDDFEFERSLLDEREQLRTFAPRVALGVLGAGPAPKQNMPSGLHLVVNGELDHCMIALEEFQEDGLEMKARTLQIDLLDQVVADQSELRVKLYDGQRATRMKNQVKLERFGVLELGWFRVVHHDPSLRALDRLIANSVEPNQ